MKKHVLSSLVGGVLMVVVSMATGWIFQNTFPQIAKEYTKGIFRPWSDPLMLLFLLYPFILAFILSFVWDKTKKLIPGEGIEKAIKFGLLYWLLTNITGMLISYSTFTVSLLMVICWSISSLAVIITGALVVRNFNR